MQSTNPALFAQLSAAQTPAAQRAISQQTAAFAQEAKNRHPQNTIAAHESRRQYETASWMAFSQSLTSAQPVVVFEPNWMGTNSGQYGAITADAFNPEWGEIVAAFQGALRFDAARLALLKFEIESGHATGLAPRYVDLNPDETDLHRHLQCELFKAIANQRLDRNDRTGRLRAAFIVCKRHVSSWTQLTPSEELKLIRAVEAGVFSPGWVYNPSACLQ